MESQELSSQESIQIITDMIGKAKKSFAKGGSFYFLLWGFTAAVANFGHYILMQADIALAPAIWVITFPAAILSVVHGVKKKNKAVVRSHFDSLYGHMWLALGVGMVVTLVFMQKIGFNHNAIILLLAGCGTYMSGRMLRFNPLILGGLSLFIGSAIAFSLSPSDQSLVAGVSLIIGYILPGYLLKREESE